MEKNGCSLLPKCTIKAVLMQLNVELLQYVFKALPQ